ncbi:MAG TPA: regulatory protein RecX [Acidobacteriaceae bacterium]|jgi:regulatory protein|nr:regulatory protein RecX [Acidobacteriaceae bacterium]
MRARRVTTPLDAEKLYDAAVKLLGQQMRTAVELKRLLRRRVEPGETGEAKIEAVVARLQERKYLNDAGYAQEYAKLRQENARFGKRRVQQDLMRKGVQGDVIGKTLDAAYDGVNEEALARQHLERKRVKKPGSEKEAARVVRMLMRAGFRSATIFKILKQWDVKDEMLQQLESIDEPGS